MKAIRAADVAAYIVERQEPLSTFKLQKLLYYCQAWCLAILDRPAFREDIEAWVNGPVVPDVYRSFRGRYTLQSGDAPMKHALTDSGVVNIVGQVLDLYGPLSGRELVERTHAELPWRQARVGLLPDERGSVVISSESMRCYYSSLLNEPRT